MKRSLATIQREIEKLQKEATAIKAKEVGGVIERIKTAIEHYGLTPEDLFTTKKRMGRPPKVEGAAPTTKVKVAKKKVASVAKYADDAGNSWTGHGKRPGWFKTALEHGKTADDLLIKNA